MGGFVGHALRGGFGRTEQDHHHLGEQVVGHFAVQDDRAHAEAAHDEDGERRGIVVVAADDRIHGAENLAQDFVGFAGFEGVADLGGFEGDDAGEVPGIGLGKHGAEERVGGERTAHAGLDADVTGDVGHVAQEPGDSLFRRDE